MSIRHCFALLPILCTSVITPHVIFAQGLTQEAASSWTVYYLKNTVSDDVAKLIAELYQTNDNEVPLKVIPDPRTNALFVTGSKEKLKELEDLLKVLDASIAPKVASSEQIEEIKVFALQSGDAALVSRVVSDLVGNEVVISVDPRTNTLIATGSRDDLDIVEAILLRLDQTESHGPLLQTYQLKNVAVDHVLKTLNDLKVEAKFAVDAKQNRLMVHGTQAAHREIAELLKMLDLPEEQPLRRRLQLRIVWLLDEKLAGENASDPAANLAGTLKVLEDKLEIKNLKTVAQMFISIDPDEDESIFDTSGTAQFSDGIQAELKITGTIKGQKSDSSVIELQIGATKNDQRSRTDPRAAMMGGRSSREQLASLMTKVVAPDNHSIVLGVTSIQSASSVFVLQVLPAEQSNP